MGTVARLGSYLATLALVFGVAWWAGILTGAPGVLAPPPAASDEHAADLDTGVPFEIESAGLVSTSAGYALVPRGLTTFARGVAGEFAFVVTGSGGQQQSDVVEPSEKARQPE